MVYTVNQLAKLAGISSRTLHYYDEIGLLNPSFIKPNGYRCYEEKELLKLQQILFFRELEFSLEEILKMMRADNFDAHDALFDQKKLLELKREKLTNLLMTIDTTMKKMKGGKNMKNDDLFASFNNDQMDEYKTEAKKRWGDTDAYKQSVERTKNWTKADYARIKEKGVKWTEAFASLREKGFATSSPEVQKMIDEHYNGLRTFYEPNYEMYKGLGQMYVSDPRFTAYYDKHGKGLASFMKDAMHEYVKNHTEK